MRAAARITAKFKIGKCSDRMDVALDLAHMIAGRAFIKVPVSFVEVEGDCPLNIQFAA